MKELSFFPLILMLLSDIDFVLFVLYKLHVSGCVAMRYDNRLNDKRSAAFA